MAFGAIYKGFTRTREEKQVKTGVGRVPFSSATFRNGIDTHPPHDARTDGHAHERASTTAQLAQGTPDAALTAIGNTRHSHTRSKCVALEASALSWENEDAIGGGENSLVRGMRTSFSHNIPKEG